MILLVDDDRVLTAAVSDVLTQHGYKVEVARNGQECLDRLARPPQPRLVILDMMMPVLDGNAVLAAVREMDGVRPPVVVLTGYLAELREDLRHVADGAYQKPVKVDELLEIVRRHERPRKEQA